MSNSGFSVLDRAEARAGLLVTFEVSRDELAMETIIARLGPAERARFQEQQDLADGQAGRSNGRIALGGYAAARSHIAQQREAEKAAARSLSYLLLMDATYRALHESANTLIDDTAHEIEGALTRLGLMHSTALEHITSMEAAALKTPDGEAVFHDGTKYRGTSGDTLDATTAATLMPKAGVTYPTWQEYSAARDHAADLDERIVKLETLRDERLEPYRQEINTDSDPASAERIENIVRDVEVIREEANDIVRGAEPLEVGPRDNAPTNFAAPLPPSS